MLTAKQQMVVDMFHEGRSPKFMARKLKTSVRIAKTYVTKLTKQGDLPGECTTNNECYVATPAIKSAMQPAQQPAVKFSGELTQMVLGATVQYLRMVGGIEQAHKLIEEVRNSAN